MTSKKMKNIAAYWSYISRAAWKIWGSCEQKIMQKKLKRDNY